MSAGSLAPTIPSTIPLRVLCCRYRLPLVPGGWFVQLCQGIGGYTEIRGTCAQEHLVTRAARLRVSCSRCLARFSGRISRSAWDSSPREGGVSCTRGATDRPVGPILPSVAQTSVCDVGKIGCGPAAGTGNVRSLEAVSFELAEGIWRWRGMLGIRRQNGNPVCGPLSLIWRRAFWLAQFGADFACWIPSTIGLHGPPVQPALAGEFHVAPGIHPRASQRYRQRPFF